MKKELREIEPKNINTGVIIFLAVLFFAAMIAFSPLFNQPLHF